MDEVTKIKKLKQQGGRGAARFRAIMLVLFLIAVVNFAPRFFSATPAPEPEPTPQIHQLTHQRQSVVILTSDTREIVRVGYEYFDNNEVVNNWQCGAQAAICHMYTPNIPANRQLFVVVEFSDGMVNKYPFSTELDYLEIDGNNRPRIEVLP